MCGRYVIHVMRRNVMPVDIICMITFKVVSGFVMQ